METLVTKKVSVVLWPILKHMEIKDRILVKSAELFLRYGIRSITMDEIAAQLGISKKTIYQFFTDKDDLVNGVVEDVIRHNEDECSRFQVDAENAVHEIFIALNEMEEMLKAMNPLIMYDLEKHHPKSFQKLKDYKYRFLYQIIKANLEKGTEEGLYREGLNVDVVTKHRIETAFMAFNQDVFPHNRYQVTEVGRELGMLFLHSITTEKGRKLIEKYSKDCLKKQL